MLFKTGEPYVHRIVQETERILRANDYLYDATIVPVAWDGHTVDLVVHTRDNWTLNPGINYNRKGGQNKASLQLVEKNLLGTGRGLEFDWGRNYDRDYVTFQYVDPHFLSTWTRLVVTYSDTSDGQTKELKLERPFYALDTRNAGGIYYLDSLRNDPRYVEGHKVGEFQHREEYYEGYGGLSTGWRDGWVTRWTAGATYQRDRFAEIPGVALGGPLPDDHAFAYPWLGVELVEDRYEKRINQDQILRTEDVLVGLRASARIGYASAALGSSHDAVIFSGYLQDGADLRPDESLFGSMNLSGRLESGTLRDGVLSAEARYYRRTSSRFKFFATVNGTVTDNLDAEDQLLLGGDTGCAAIRCATRPARASALLTLEERYYTDWYRPVAARRRHGSARLSAALPGRHVARTADARRAVLHQLVSVPAVPRRGRGVLRHGPHLGHGRHRRDQPRIAEGRRHRIAVGLEPLGIRQRAARRPRVSARRRSVDFQRAVPGGNEGTILTGPCCTIPCERAAHARRSTGDPRPVAVRIT